MEIQDGSATFKIRNITELVKNLEDLQTKNTQLADQLAEVTTIQKVDVSFNSTYLSSAYVYKVGHIVNGHCAFRKSVEDADVPIITKMPKSINDWGAIVTPFNAFTNKGKYLRVNMKANTTVLNLHYSNAWETTKGNEAEIFFTYITAD